MVTPSPHVLVMERFDQLYLTSSVESLLDILGGSETSLLQLDIRLCVLRKLEQVCASKPDQKQFSTWVLCQVLRRISGPDSDGNRNEILLLARILWKIHMTKTFQTLKEVRLYCAKCREGYLNFSNVELLSIQIHLMCFPRG